MVEAFAKRVLRALLGRGAGLLLACLALAAPVQAADSLHVAVRVASANDRLLLERIRGQLSDVHVQLSVVETAALEASFASQVDAAHALAEAHGAQAVLWFSSRQDTEHVILVHLATVREDRILTRRLRADAKGSVADSGLLEAAALVVRTAVSALASGGAIGVATQEAIATAEQLAAPASASAGPVLASTSPPNTVSSMDAAHPTQPLTAQPRTTETRAAERAQEPPQPQPQAEAQADGDSDSESPEPGFRGAADWHADVFAGFQSVLDGETEYGQRAVNGRVGLGYRGVMLGAYGAAALDATIPDRFVALHVARHSLGATLDGVIELGTHVRWALGAHAGALWFTRTSEPKASYVQVTQPSVLHALVVGPETWLSWLPAGPVGFGLSFALDVLPRAPSFDLGMQSGAPARHTLWTLEPRASIGVEARLP